MGAKKIPVPLLVIIRRATKKNAMLCCNNLSHKRFGAIKKCSFSHSLRLTIGSFANLTRDASSACGQLLLQYHVEPVFVPAWWWYFWGVCISCTAAFPDRSVRSMVVRDEFHIFIFYYLAGSVKCPFLQRFEGTQSHSTNARPTLSQY